MVKKTLPTSALEFFREQGRIGGKKGGKRSLDTMTPKARHDRAKRAVAAREAKRAARNKPK